MVEVGPCNLVLDMTAPKDNLAPTPQGAPTQANLKAMDLVQQIEASTLVAQSHNAHVHANAAAAALARTGASMDRIPHAGLSASDAGLLPVSSTDSLGGHTANSSATGSGNSQAQRNKTLYLGNLHPFVTETHLRELFAGLLGITELKVIKDKATGVSAGYGFAKFTDQAFAQVALDRVNKAVLFGQELRVNWAFLKEQPEECAVLVHIFVGDLAPDVTDAVLLAAFQACPGCTDARVQWDHATGRSRGYGFVSFTAMEDAENAIAAMHGQFVGSRRVRCGNAQHKTDAALPTNPNVLDRADPTNTNIYVGNLAASLSDAEVRRHFATFGPLAEVKLHRKGGFGFVRYKAHEDAVRAIIGMNGSALAGKQLKCSWGRHPNTPPSGMQTSLMLAAAAGIGPLALPQANTGGLLPPMGNFMAGSVLGMPMAGGGGAAGLQGQTMQSMQSMPMSNMGGNGGDGLIPGGGVMPLEHIYGGPGGYGIPGPYGNMGQVFFPGQPNQ